MPKNPTSVLPAPPFRLQLSLADVVEHRGWRHARVSVLDALERGESVAVLGPSGTGKTLLLRSIAQALEGLGWTVATAASGGAMAGLAEADVVMVDEGGGLSAQALAELDALSQPMVVAALPGFAPRLAGLARRIAWVTLGPLSPEEVARLVAARMRAAGRARDVFEPEAVRELAHHSGGMLRLVLVLAGAALFIAERDGAERVTAEHVADAAAMRADPVEDDPPAPLEPPAGPAPMPPAVTPSVADAAEPRVRLADARAPARGATGAGRSRAWVHRVTLVLAATGLALAAVAALVVPRLAQPPAPRGQGSTPVIAPEAAPPPASTAGPLPPLVPSPLAVPLPVPPVQPEPDTATEAPGEVAVVPPMPPPPPVARRPPPAVRPRPMPLAEAPVASPSPAPVPPAQLQPLAEDPVPVAPSPWASDRPPPSASPEAPAGPRIVTREAANIRGQPNLGSPVLRVTSAGMVLRVFDRRGPWVQVGDSAPWGWVHSAVVAPAR